MKPAALYRFSFIPLLLLSLSASAWAALGDNAASVLTDQARLKGSALHSTDNRTYVVHEIATTYGSKVREYVSPGGAVFGVAWEGPFQPNFQHLLGAYYEQAKQAQAAAAAKAASASGPRARGGPVVIDTPGLVIYQGGHMRAYHGIAYVPQLVPQGVKAADIR
jgi:hypothetical protein